MIRVAVVTTELTASRVPQLDRLAQRPELELQVFYAAESIQGRTWSLQPRHPHEILRGPSLPLERLLFHDYPVTPGLWRKLSRGRFDVAVVWGWSVFAAQLAVVWARVHRVPYVVFSESQLVEPRSWAVHVLKRLVVPRVVRPAAGLLVTGTRAREHLVHYGGDPAAIRVFANTVDVASLERRVDAARERRAEIRARLGLADEDVAVLYAGRLVPVKAVEVLAASVARAGPPFRLVVAGDGPERERVERAAAPASIFTGFQGEAGLAETYAAADVFALLSRKETWGVVVVEAAAAGLPIVVSARVGAGADLVEDRVNGRVVPADDPAATADALRGLADGELRRIYGARSRERAAGWGYGPSEDAFVAAVTDALSRRQTSRGAGP
ncbi:MAG TPA: glycosyltransferase family 4 protein [Gaiellaceae bacterium]|nr:glycosyltransferase family 4 protein [Gaiellaceae bacterium]